MKMKHTRRIGCALAVASLAATTQAQTPFGSALTYQARLEMNGALWTAPPTSSSPFTMPPRVEA